MNRREIPQPGYDDPKEPYAFFGLAFHDAQVLEQGAVDLAAALNAKEMGNVTGGDVLELYEGCDGKTSGVQRLGKRDTRVPFFSDANSGNMGAVLPALTGFVKRGRPAVDCYAGINT